MDMDETIHREEDNNHSHVKPFSRLSGHLRFVFATAILIVCMIVFSVVFILRVYFMTESKCYEDLARNTSDAVTELEGNLRSDRTMLRIISGMIGQADDLNSLEVSSFLSTYDINSMISQIGILTPDNEAISVTGHKSDMRGLLYYDAEAAAGEHISTLQPSAYNDNVSVIRNYVPIRKNGGVIAMLYSASRPSNIAQAWLPDIYGGEACCYVVDRKSGDILVNSSADNLTNIRDISFTQTLRDYTKESAVNDILGGKKGYSVYRSSASRETLYMCYLPFGMVDWEMVVTVSGYMVFSAVRPIQAGMIVLFILILLVLILYAMWMFREIRRSVIETERRANIDILTGLQNRNRYENYLKQIDKDRENLTCIYIDANGLHELNNSRGHLAGDQMLRFIADALKVQFGEEHTYRIGGDEFVVFQSNRTEKELLECLNEFNASLQRNDYHAAVGLCVYGFGMSVDQLIKNAEKEMYEAKRKYYERIGKVMRV